ncbi:MAG TPA: asparaginase [Beutenbergiaceae bacterium]|nr:asparaginase [Beutenbergiaceae bacterium]
MARVAFIGTGGTFSNEGKGALDYLDYLDSGAVMATEDVLGLMPDVSHLADIHPVGFAQLRSKAVGPAEWEQLAQVVTSQVQDPGIDGVVITHGTGVLEETAFYLHLRVNTTKPIVVLGAQRPPTTVGSDAAKNFVDSLHWIRHHVREGQPAGVVTVMNQEVHSARDVAKLSNHTLGALESPGAGPLARVNADGTVTIYRYPTAAHTHTSEFTTPAISPEGIRVDVVHQYAGADATMLNACVEAGARGVVVVGFPPGTNTPDIDHAIKHHASNAVVIVQASRAIRDPHILDRTGLNHVVKNTDLSPQHARILLMFALHAGAEQTQVQDVFDRY